MPKSYEHLRYMGRTIPYVHLIGRCGTLLWKKCCGVWRFKILFGICWHYIIIYFFSTVDKKKEQINLFNLRPELE